MIYYVRTLKCRVSVSGLPIRKVKPCSHTGSQDLIVLVRCCLLPTLASRYTSGCLFPFTRCITFGFVLFFKLPSDLLTVHLIQKILIIK